MVTSTERLHLQSSQSSPNGDPSEKSNEILKNPKSKSLPREAIVSEEVLSKSEVGKSAPEVRKNAPEVRKNAPEVESDKSEPVKEKVLDREADQVRSIVDSLKERNMRLARLNQALSLELKDLISERVSLESKENT
jgi:hypothetical protein